MFPCPWCKKTLPGLVRECPSCHADLTLIINYVENLAGGIARAEAMTRAGQLDAAVWTYLEILEVDPENAVARRQVGRVAAAVRQFDQASPNRKWQNQLQKKHRFRRWLASWSEDGNAAANLVWLLLVVVALLLGLLLGQQMRSTDTSDSQPAETSSR